MFNLTGYVRAMFRDAALAGVQDAMAVITPEGETPPVDLAEVRARFAATVAPKQLAAPTPAEVAEPAADAPRGRKAKA